MFLFIILGEDSVYVNVQVCRLSERGGDPGAAARRHAAPGQTG